MITYTPEDLKKLIADDLGVDEACIQIYHEESDYYLVSVQPIVVHIGECK